MMSGDLRAAFSDFVVKPTFETPVHGFYLDKNNGVIVRISFGHSENEFHKELKDKVEKSLTPLIAILEKADQKAIDDYEKTGGKLSDMPVDHPSRIISKLHWALETNVHFFGNKRPALSPNAIRTNIPDITMDQMADALAKLTNIDSKEAYKFLLKLNACKAQYYSMDSNLLTRQNSMGLFGGKGSTDYYKKGYEEIISFADFLKKIEKSIAYIVTKANESDQDNRHKIQKRN